MSWDPMQRGSAGDWMMCVGVALFFAVLIAAEFR